MAEGLGFAGHRRRVPLPRHHHQLPRLALDLARSPGAGHVAADRRSSRRSSSTGSRGATAARASARRCSRRSSTSRCPTASSSRRSTRSAATGSCDPSCSTACAISRRRRAAAARARGLPLDRPGLARRCSSSSPAASATSRVLILVIARGRSATRRHWRRCPSSPTSPSCGWTSWAAPTPSGWCGLRLQPALRRRRRRRSRRGPPPRRAGRGQSLLPRRSWSATSTPSGVDPRRPGRPGDPGAARRAPATGDGPPRPAQRGREGHDQGGERHRTAVPGAAGSRRPTRPSARPEEVARHLERLDELDLTPRRTAAPEPEYQFKHAMTQEAAYQSLTFQLRESLHERVGLFIERDLSRAPRPVRRRARPSLRSHAAESTSSGCGSGPPVTRPRPPSPTRPPSATTSACCRSCRRSETGEVLVELGGVWHLTGRWAEAERAYRRAMEVAARAGRRDILAAGQRDLGDLFMYNRSYAEAVTLADRRGRRVRTPRRPAGPVEDPRPHHVRALPAGRLRGGARRGRAPSVRWPPRPATSPG